MTDSDWIGVIRRRPRPRAMATVGDPTESFRKAGMDARVSTRSGRPPKGTIAEKRERLLLSVEELLASGNYRNLSVDEIAQFAGISKKTVYALFETKDALIEHVIGRSPAVFEPGLGSDAANLDAARDELRIFLRQLSEVTFAPRWLGLFQLAMASDSSRLRSVYVHAMRQQGLETIERWLRQCVARQVVGCEDCSKLAMLILAIVVDGPLLQFAMQREALPPIKRNDWRIDDAVNLLIAPLR
jgi:AcrR family transcriptional regulator